MGREHRVRMSSTGGIDLLQVSEIMRHERCMEARSLRRWLGGLLSLVAAQVA